jgi:hypothetical protein
MYAYRRDGHQQQKEQDMGLKENDMVKVNAPTHSLHGEVGTIVFAFSDGNSFVVRFASGRESGFFLPELELELVDAKREGLIQLADTLDKARLQANAIEATAPQRGVYGNISDTLVEVLCLLTGRFEVGDIYDALMDGNTVREALTIAGVK